MQSLWHICISTADSNLTFARNGHRTTLKCSAFNHPCEAWCHDIKTVESRVFRSIGIWTSSLIEARRSGSLLVRHSDGWPIFRMELLPELRMLSPSLYSVTSRTRRNWLWPGKYRSFPRENGPPNHPVFINEFVFN